MLNILQNLGGKTDFFFFSVAKAGSFYLVDKACRRKARGSAGSQSHHYGAVVNDYTRPVSEISWG